MKSHLSVEKKRTKTLGVANRFMVGGTLCPLGLYGVKGEVRAEVG